MEFKNLKLSQLLIYNKLGKSSFTVVLGLSIVCCFLVPSPFLRKVIQFSTGPLNVLSWSLKRFIRIAAFVHVLNEKILQRKWCTGSVQCMRGMYQEKRKLALCLMELVELVYCWHRSPWATLKHFCINSRFCNRKSVLADATRRLTVKISWNHYWGFSEIALRVNLNFKILRLSTTLL
jgi:hypothetical protein